MRSFFVASISLAVQAGCGHPAQEKQPPCPNGICGTTGGSGGGGTTGGTAGGGGTTGGTAGGGGAGASSATAATTGAVSSSSGGCMAAWTCTPWTKGSDGLYSRTCTDENGCTTAAGKPPEGPIDLPALDLDYYRCKVEPIFDRSCAFMGCHGMETGRAFKIYARGRLRHKEMVKQVGSCPVGPQTLDLQANGSATIMCLGWSPHTAAEWQSNYDISRSFMLGVTSPDQSDLLAQPVVGGKSHAGVHLFRKDDPDYTTIKSWLTGTQLGSPCDPAPN
jgi:hypothetical protein